MPISQIIAFIRPTVSLAAAGSAFLLLVACGGADQPATQDGGAASSDAATSSNAAPSAASPDAPAPAGTPLSTASAEGEVLYSRCVACHQTTGAGLAGAFPPLAGSEWVTGNPVVPIRILLHGLQGPITVAGAEYNSVMLPYGGMGEMSDSEAAAVLTYVRGAFGNSATAVTAAQVAAERAATADRTTAWTAAELQPLLK